MYIVSWNQLLVIYMYWYILLSVTILLHLLIYIYQVYCIHSSTLCLHVELITCSLNLRPQRTVTVTTGMPVRKQYALSNHNLHKLSKYTVPLANMPCP